MIRWLNTIIICLFVTAPFTYSQGLPVIHIYTPEDYGDFRQNWDIAQDSKGYLYFGNSNGLVRFDGAKWESRYIGAGRIVRTLTSDGKTIHWAGNRNFGYIGSDSIHSYQPVSLVQRLDSTERNISNIWDSIEHNGNVYHRSFDAIYKVSGDSITIIRDENPFLGVHSLFGSLIINRQNRPLASFDNGVFTEIPNSEFYDNEVIFSVLPFEEGYLLMSRELGIIYFDGTEFSPFDTDVSDYLHEHLIYRSVWLNDDEIAIATLRGGIVIINKKGEHLFTLREENGLPTNIIYDLYVDPEGILWGSTDNGIVKIFVNQPIRVLNELYGLSGANTFIHQHEETVYIGTTERLYTIQNSGVAEPIKEINGRVFDAVSAGNHLFVTGADGLYLIDRGDISHINSKPFSLLDGGTGDQDKIFGVVQNRLYRIDYDQAVAYADTLREFDSVIRDFIVQDDVVWVATADRRVHRIEPVTGRLIQSYDAPIAENSQLQDLIYADNKILLTTDSGLFYYDFPTGNFIADSTYNDPELNTWQVTRAIQCENGGIWFRNNRKIKQAVLEGEAWRVIENPYRTIGKGQAITDIHCSDDGSVWLAGSSIVYRIQNPKWEPDGSFQTNITGVIASNDSLYMGFGSQPIIPRLPYKNNNLRFTYAAASFADPGETHYRVKLNGYEDAWGEWTLESQKDYTFIREGTYTFEVESRNIFQQTGSVDTYTFTILPPWYRTFWAYLSYIILLSGLIYTGHKIRVNSILKEQRIRDGIARDLHDELSSTLSSINFFADAIDSHKLDTDKTGRFLTLIQKSSQEAKEKISDIVWVIHSDNDDWQNLLLRCKRFAADLLDARGIKHTFDIKGTFSGKPTINQRKNIWLIFREILTNSARHAQPQEVHIHFSLHSGHLTMHVEDNGKGFDPGEISRDGNGVRNIKERTSQLNGTYTLQAKPGEGTRWLIEVDLG